MHHETFQQKTRWAANRTPVIWVLLVSFVYSVILTSIPWESVRGASFFDLDVYLSGFKTGAYDYLDEIQGIAYIFSEPLWRYIVSNLALRLGGYELAFSALSFTISFCFACYIISLGGRYFIFLCAPIVIDVFISQVRSGLMSAIFLVAYASRSKVILLASFPIAALIHSTAFILYGFYGLVVAVQYLHRHSLAPRYAVAVSTAVIPYFFVVVYSGVLSAVGDRRENYEAAWVGGSFFYTFLACYLAMLMNLKKMLERHVTIYILFITGFFLVLSLHNINVLRIMGSVFPLFITSTIALPSTYRNSVFALLVSMCIYHFFLWI